MKLGPEGTHAFGVPCPLVKHKQKVLPHAPSGPFQGRVVRQAKVVPQPMQAIAHQVPIMHPIRARSQDGYGSEALG